METIINEYQQQALDFLQSTGATMEIKFSHNGYHFDGDKDTRDIYDVTLMRGSRIYSFKFGNSTADSGFYYTKGRQKTQLDRKHLVVGKTRIGSFVKNKIDWSFLNNGSSDIVQYPTAPDEYSVLACLTSYDPYTFEDFCSTYGYDEDSRTAEKVYKAVTEEYKSLCALFSEEEMQKLAEIN